MKRRRLFAGVAVAAPAALRGWLGDVRRALAGERIRWVGVENLHLTVEFFGETDEERIPELGSALAQAARRTPPFSMAIGGLGVFGGRRHPRVLWAGIESPGLQRLHGEVEAALRTAGRVPEARAFAPHLTLGRLERLERPERLAAAVERWRGQVVAELAVRELILYESRPGERAYVPLERQPLAGPPEFV